MKTKIYQLIGIITLSLCLFIPSQAQDNLALPYNIKTTKIKKLGKTEPLTNLSDNKTEQRSKKDKYKSEKKGLRNFKWRGKTKVNRPELEHQGDDLLRQFYKSNGQDVPVQVNQDGIFGGFGSPHDPSGDIGLDHYIQMVQAIGPVRIGIFSKDGTLIQTVGSNDIWSPFGHNGVGDPIVLFDEFDKRWILTEFADPANILIAVSETSDPLGSYNVYNFSTPQFPDYPKYGIWPNALIFTSNESGAGQLHNYFIDREALMRGDQNVTMQRIEIQGNFNTEAGFFVTTPLDFSGSIMPKDSFPIVMKLNDSSWGDVAQDQVELFRFDIDWDNIDSTTFERIDIVTSPYDGYPCSIGGFGQFPCMPQLNGPGLDGIPEVIMNVPQYRNFGTHESMVMCFITDVTDGQNQSGIRWMELRKTDSQDWHLYQEGTYAPDEKDRYMCSIAIDKFGNIGLGYNVSSPDEFVSMRCTGRLVTDPLGEMTFNETIITDGFGPINSGTRFGDYAQMMIDPVDEITFWYTGEYAGEESSRTRIFSFRLQKYNIDAAPLKIDNPLVSTNLSTDENISVTVSNLGLDPIANLDIGLIFEGNTVSTFTIPDTLFENDTYQHTFDASVDMSAVRSYNVGVFTSTTLDELPANDTIFVNLQNISGLEAALDLESTEFETCNDTFRHDLVIMNNGFDTLQSVQIEQIVNGISLGNVAYDVNVAFNENQSIEIATTNLIDGANEIEYILTEVNESQDSNISNNSTILNVNFTSEDDEITVRLTTDGFPQETSWILIDDVNRIIARSDELTEAGTTTNDVICLDPNACYSFIISDTYGDGICCYSGDGSYELITSDGTVLASGGDFSDSETKTICPSLGCLIDADILVDNSTNSNSSNGGILITPTSGNAPYMYSIDGGGSFQDGSLFSDLSPGEYNVVVTSDEGDCQYKETVVVDAITSISDIELNNTSIRISPNPGKGFYSVKMHGDFTEDYIIKMQVLDLNGKTIQSRPIQKYNSVFEGELSLVDFPSGTYYIKLFNNNFSKIARVIKL